MKGALGMPLEILVGIIIATIIILFALMSLGLIPGLGGGEAYKGSFYACCTSYVFAGGCEAADYNFQCTVDTAISSTGKMGISELAAKIGQTPENCCR